MPDAGEQLHHEQIEDLPLQALAVAAQRDIDCLLYTSGVPQSARVDADLIGTAFQHPVKILQRVEIGRAHV